MSDMTNCRKLERKILIDDLRELLICDGVAGKLFWRVRSLKWFPDQRACNSWNARFAGKEAFRTFNSGGYFEGRILGFDGMAHRIIWAMEKGEWPDQIDHDNRKRRDNRIANLTDATPVLNARNRSIPKNNASGVVGVFWHNGKARWCAGIGSGKRRLHLGYFKDKESASLARRAAEQRFGYHPNHGRGA